MLTTYRSPLSRPVHHLLKNRIKLVRPFSLSTSIFAYPCAILASVYLLGGICLDFISTSHVL